MDVSSSALWRILCASMVVLLAFSTASAQEPVSTQAPDGGAGRVMPPVPTGSPAERQAWLRTRIDELLATPSLRAAKVGVAVMEVESGRVLYARGEKAS